MADGLHVIDFEQLKIENQTLNEKIEERQEELTKLRQKIVTTVVYLSHYREKVKFIRALNETRGYQVTSLNSNLMDQKGKLTKLKKQRDKIDKTCQELKQDTGIVSNSSMKDDHEKRELQNKSLVEEIYQLKQHHQMLKDQIKHAR